ncbi:MAG: serine/threonine-protein kinase [Polyangiaceae bacterium]|nr:serine/threonine-protein kinase [Polyangiaceae bacterium]
MSTSEADHPKPLPGEIFFAGQILDDKYELQAHIATGGQAVVWRARHLFLGRLVVIKVLRPDLANNANIVERFVDEARVLAALESEHIARILDYGLLEHGLPFMVMEYLEGRDLRYLLCEAGPLPVNWATFFIAQACEGLAEAHRNGIIHRDIKPENLFVCERTKRVKLLDFGIAIAVNQERHLTHPGEPVGSPSYMAPEQLRTQDIDLRADIWALGAVLHELISGECAFDGASLAQICTAVLTAAPRRLSEFRAAVPAGLQEVVDRCLSKDRALRFGNTRELAAELTVFCPELVSAQASAIALWGEAPGLLSEAADPQIELEVECDSSEADPEIELGVESDVVEVGLEGLEDAPRDPFEHRKNSIRDIDLDFSDAATKGALLVREPKARWDLFVLIVVVLALGVFVLHESPRWLPKFEEWAGNLGLLS